jgi:Sensors of blue-light using FAD
MSLYCLVYTSIASKKMSDDDLKFLLKTIRKNNDIREVTGILLYLDPFFIQVLEGGEAVVTDLFNRIKQDSRHNKVSLIYKKPIEERYFSDWTMGFSKITYENVSTMEGFSDFLQRPTVKFFSNSPNKVDELLYKFKYEILF